MVTFVLPDYILARHAKRLSGRSDVLIPVRRDRPEVIESDASHSTSSDPATPDDFETEAFSAKEDRTRARRMRRVLNRPGRTTWLNIADRLWLLKKSPRHAHPHFDRDAIQDLAERLEAGVASGFPPPTLASSLRMRTIRLGLGHALLDDFSPYSDADLRTVTVIYGGWSFKPAELDGVTAAQLKRQFRRHLERAGVLKVAGPLFAVLHGEFEPRSGCYVLHFHLVTTAAKAAALKAGLTAKKIRGYVMTATGSVPVRRSRIGDRIGQLTYLAKAYWPSRPVIRINGKLKRVRDPRRIQEPFGTQVLMWLDRQTFSDLVLTHDCWSRRNGGTAAMRQLCLFVAGVG